MPERIQRKRSKGWRMPEGTIYVGRPTKWGNPFNIQMESQRDIAVAWFEANIPPGLAKAARAELRGKDLACWCPLDKPCHADVLLKLANVDPAN